MMVEKVSYTGPIDSHVHYSLGYLKYRSLRFESEILDKLDFHGNAAVNYTVRMEKICQRRL